MQNGEMLPGFNENANNRISMNCLTVNEVDNNVVEYKEYIVIENYNNE